MLTFFTDLCDALAKSLALNDKTPTTGAPLQPAFLALTRPILYMQVEDQSSPA